MVGIKLDSIDKKLFKSVLEIMEQSPTEFNLNNHRVQLQGLYNIYFPDTVNGFIKCLKECLETGKMVSRILTDKEIEANEEALLNRVPF